MESVAFVDDPAKFFEKQVNKRNPAPNGSTSNRSSRSEIKGKFGFVMFIML